MLERFHVPHDEEIRIEYSDLRRLSVEILKKSGMNKSMPKLLQMFFLKLM